MGSLLEWFKNRREENIIKETRIHAKKVYDCIFELNKLILLFFEGKLHEVPSLIKKVSELEHECDDIRRKIMIDLTKGELEPSIREDLAHLINRLDAVANNTNATAKRFGLLTNDSLIPIADELKKMSGISLKCVEILYKTIDLYLGRASQQVYSNITEINKLEHDIDVINFAIKEKLSKIQPNYSPYTAILLFEMVNLLENISDNAEETAEFIKIIKVRHDVNK